MNDSRDFELIESPRPSSSAPAIPWGLIVVAIAVAFLLLRIGPDGGDRERNTYIDAGGLHVLIAEETEDRDQLSAKQVAIFNSVKLREWCDSNCAQVDGETAFRSFDFDDDVSREDPIWQEMLDAADGDLSLVVAKDNKATVMPLPKSVESVIKTLEDYK